MTSYSRVLFSSVSKLIPRRCTKQPSKSMTCQTSAISSGLTFSPNVYPARDVECNLWSSNKRQLCTSSHLKEQEHFRQSESPSYEGTGKTTVTILNEEVQYVMIDAFSLSGFTLNTGLKGEIRIF